MENAPNQDSYFFFITSVFGIGTTQRLGQEINTDTGYTSACPEAEWSYWWCSPDAMKQQKAHKNTLQFKCYLNHDGTCNISAASH